MAERALGAEHVLRHAPFHERALGFGKGMEHITPSAGKRPLITGLLFALESASHLVWSEAGVDRDDRLLIGEENPVPVFPGQLAPGTVDVITKRSQNVALILSLPGGRPRGDGALANGEGVIGHHRAF